MIWDGIGLIYGWAWGRLEVFVMLFRVRIG